MKFYSMFPATKAASKLSKFSKPYNKAAIQATLSRQRQRQQSNVALTARQTAIDKVNRRNALLKSILARKYPLKNAFAKIKQFRPTGQTRIKNFFKFGKRF